MDLTIGIVGAGAMGRGIAQALAAAGNKVILCDTNIDSINRAKEQLTAILDKLVAKGQLEAGGKEKIIAAHQYRQTLSSFNQCDLVIEAIIEKFEAKVQLFKELENIVSGDCIIASNTSSLSLTELAYGLKNPAGFIGIHFFNPAPLMELVEVIPSLQTNSHTVSIACNWMRAAGKTVVLAKDTPGFIVNRIARTYYSEAIRILEEGIADIATIDWAMTTIGQFKMGPFQLMDFIGHDVNFVVTETIYRALYEEPRYKPSITQKKLLEAKYLGRKSSRGFYDYHQPLPQPVINESLGRYIFNRILVMLINDAADALYFKIANRDDIDTAMKKGVNYPKGLLAWADDYGLEKVLNEMDDLFNHYHEERYRASALIRSMAATGKNFYQPDLTAFDKAVSGNR